MNASKKLFTLGLATLAMLISFNSNAQSSVEVPIEESAVQTPSDPSNDDPDRERPVGVEENEIQKLMLYPNPSIGSEFTMELPLPDFEPIVMYIFDMNGRVVEKKSGTYGELQHFRFRNLEEATYIIRVFAKESFFQSRVIVRH